jgi:transcriptional regulator with XRE-family HTH domain
LSDPWKRQLEVLGRYIRTQREVANLSLREVAQLSSISNAYISQIERGLNEPSLRVLRALASALGVPSDELLEAAGLLDDDEQARRAAGPGTASAIRTDPALTDSQKEALLSVYRSFARPDTSAAPAAADGDEPAAG